MAEYPENFAATLPIVRPTHAWVDENALRHNFQTIQSHVGSKCRVLAVVKADAYGHGAENVAQVLVEAGVWGFAVSLVEEGLALRSAGIRVPILVLGGADGTSADVLVHRALTPVVWSINHLVALKAAVQRAGAVASPVHLKIDTGMSRLGVLPEHLSQLLEWFEREGGAHLRLEGVMTHLACADDSRDEATNSQQLAVFQHCLAAISSRGMAPQIRHVCNSAGLVRMPSAHFDMVRPGIALYGAGACKEVALSGLRLAMNLHSRVIFVRELPQGSRISYGGTYTLSRDSRVAVVPVGYADGYPRNMSGQAQVLIRGHRCAVLGVITMDICMVDVTDLPDVRAGEQVTLLGSQGRDEISIYELAAWAKEIPYEIICGISKRVPRRQVSMASALD